MNTEQPGIPEETKAMQNQGWIAVDLDGTLARYDGWVGVEHIGAPVPAMLERVKSWICEGRDVRIFTARVDGGSVALNMGDEAGKDFENIARVRSIIETWCLKHVGIILPVTNQKDYGMIELWDDRCVQVIPNEGIAVAERIARLTSDLAAANLRLEGLIRDNQASAAEVVELRQQIEQLSGPEESVEEWAHKLHGG